MNTSGDERVENDSNHKSTLAGDVLGLSYPTSGEPVIEYDRTDIPRGEITALVEPSGSGKNTLLKSLAKQLPPDSSNVYLDGKFTNGHGGKAFAHGLGMPSQRRDSPMSLTVEGLIYRDRYPHRDFFKQVNDDNHEAVEHAINLADIEHIRDKQIDNLSSDQSQLAWIAVVLTQDTDVLLLDEPMTYPDLYRQLRVLETARQLNEERDVTVAVALHDIAQAARSADYPVTIQGGELYDRGLPREVVAGEFLADVLRIETTVNYLPDPEIVPKRSL